MAITANPLRASTDSIREELFAGCFIGLQRYAICSVVRGFIAAVVGGGCRWLGIRVYFAVGSALLFGKVQNGTGQWQR